MKGIVRLAENLIGCGEVVQEATSSVMMSGYTRGMAERMICLRSYDISRKP